MFRSASWVCETFSTTFRSPIRMSLFTVIDEITVTRFRSVTGAVLATVTDGATAAAATCGAVPSAATPARARSTFSRPPLATLPASDVSVSTLPRTRAITSRYESEGFALQARATAPATCGEAIEVPLFVPYPPPGSVLRMLDPGAARSTEAAP